MTATHNPSPAPANLSVRTASRALRWLRRLFLMTVLIALLVVGVWAWLGSASSVRAAAFAVNRWVPGVQVGPVSGSLREGGRIDTVAWTDQATSVHIDALDWSWRPDAPWWQVLRALVLADGAQQGVSADSGVPVDLPLYYASLRAQRVAVVLPPASDEASAPLVLPQSVRLPVGLDLGLEVDVIEVTQGEQVHRLGGLRAHYHHAGGMQAHVLDINGLQYGDLTASAHLRALAFERWPVQVQLQVATPATRVADHLVAQRLSASVSLAGELADGQVAGQVVPAALTLKAEAMGNGRRLLSASATLSPWAAQPVEQASVTLSRVNAAVWLPPGSGVPATDLSGVVRIKPTEPGTWLADVALTHAPTAQVPAGQLAAHLRWNGDALEVSGLDLAVVPRGTAPAWLRGSGVWRRSSGQVQARLQAQAPGMGLETQLSAGLQRSALPVGRIALNVENAAQLTQWINQLAQRTQLVPPLDLSPSGSLQVDASFSAQGQVSATLRARNLSVPVDGITAELTQATVALSNTWQDLGVQVDAQGRWPGQAESAQVHATTRLSVDADARALAWRELMWRVSVRDLAQRVWQASSTSVWRGQFKGGVATGNASGLSVGLQSCEALSCAALVSWQDWSASAQGVDFKGRLDNISAALAQAVMATAATPPRTDWRTDVVMGGVFQARLGPAHQPDVRLSLSKTRGDFSVSTGDSAGWQALDVQVLDVDVQWRGSALQARASAMSRLVGSSTAELSTSLQAQGWSVLATPTAPVQGQAQFRLNEITWLKPWLPPGLQVGGTVQADVRLSGTQEKPLVTGSVDGQRLFARDQRGAFELGGGVLQARLDADGMEIERFYLHGVGSEAQGGHVEAKGRLDWSQAADTSARLSLKLVGFQVASQADRRIRLSGDLSGRWVGGRLAVNGDLRVDKADITLSKLGAPSLGDDVVIVGRAPLPPSQPLPLDLDIDLSLGQDFQVTGFGLTTGLRGQLRIGGPDANNQPILNGEVNTVQARYKAYGQDLVVQRGRLVFAGRPDAPVLDILAVRALTEPQVGVQVQGPLRAPRVELYANVPMANSEKLSWLLLGHPSARGGSEAALIQNAVLALVGDTNALMGGVDEFSINGETRLSDGTTRAAQFTVGKQLGERLYTSYTRSVASVQGLLSVYLKLTSSLSVRAQTGEANNVDLVWSRAYD